MVILQRFSGDTGILAELTHLNKSPLSIGVEPTRDYVLRREVWSMLFVDDASIDSRSPRGLAKMMNAIVKVS